MKCTKTSYATEEFANEHIAILKKKSKRSVKPTRAYKCNKCNSYHLTSQPDYVRIINELEERVKMLTKKVSLLNSSGENKGTNNNKLSTHIVRLEQTLSKRKKTIEALERDNRKLMDSLIKANLKLKEK